MVPPGRLADKKAGAGTGQVGRCNEHSVSAAQGRLPPGEHDSTAPITMIRIDRLPTEREDVL
jgi:hypothetical protein